MSVTYRTCVVGYGNHASLHVPDEVLAELGANRRAPLRISINGHTYRSTATVVNGECHVVFPLMDRSAAHSKAGDYVDVTLELEVGRREVELPSELASALDEAGLRDAFEALSYSKRREFARLVAEARATETRARRVEKVLANLEGDRWNDK